MCVLHLILISHLHTPTKDSVGDAPPASMELWVFLFSLLLPLPLPLLA